MRRLPLLLLPLLAGCVGYPRPYFTRVHGRADLDGGQPYRIEGAIIKECETIKGGQTERIIRRRGDDMDKDGNYSFWLWGVTWNFKNHVSLSECTSYIQRFACRPYCKKADAIDIDVLGK